MIQIHFITNQQSIQQRPSFKVLLNPEDSGLPLASKVQAQQVRTISKPRIVPEVVNSLSEELRQIVDAALKLHLGLE